ncbi:sporulation integral membrane protein YtvI [Haloimpatiens lingqiaonensis]|uniref:sporulation integral membrane protein YtvI n=1 Tax=Haloimpatiens lingqiaonensis TaxID=1380675 RepID=UPI0010FDBF51|nr:sporulation integral membrane protein YtvI [Haloimpatiens lingqiaonensis]
MNSLLEKLDRTIVFIVAYTLIFILFFSTLGYTLPFVLGILFAILLQKPVKFLTRKFKIKSWISSLIVTIIFFAIIITLLSLGITSLTSESIELGKNIQSYINKNSNKIMGFFNNLQTNYHHLDPSIASTIEKNLSSFTSKSLNLTMAFTKKALSLFLIFLAKIPYTIMVILFTLLSTYFFTKDLSAAKNKIFDLLPKSKSDRLYSIILESKKMLSNYIASYLFIIFITFLETLIGFLIFKVKYAVLLSVLCGIFDLLPVLGIGAIYIPLAIIYFLSKNYIGAVGILILYAIVSVIRQVIEPKIVSSSLGLHPVAVLAAIFIGLKANGIGGMFFCIFLVVFYNILKKVEVL